MTRIDAEISVLCNKMVKNAEIIAQSIQSRILYVVF